MRPSKSSLFLMELIISILFFSIASAVCIQLFVKAHLLNNRTQEQNQTVVWSQNLAELWRAYDGDNILISDQLRVDYECQDSSIYLTNVAPYALVLYFNQDWELSDRDIVYHVVLSGSTYDSESRLINSEIQVSRGEELLYSLPLSHHIAEGGTMYER
ncbi:MAG: hypothetical protein J1E65_09615 [Lachnospiraceae bacterium]|nr:hypothetical protein [Lachnospiraceae bacterium]